MVNILLLGTSIAVCHCQMLTISTRKLVNKVVADLKRGKAAGIDGLSAEHLIYSYPCLSVLIAQLYQLMITSLYVPRGF